MTGRKIYLRMVRKIEEWENLDWYEQIHVGRPPIPYVPLLTAREDWQERPCWLRTRSNPFQTNYH